MGKSQTYTHVQMYNKQQILLEPNVLWIVKMSWKTATVTCSSKIPGCGFCVEVVLSYHISRVSYRTAEDHTEYHAKDLKQREPLVRDLQCVWTHLQLNTLPRELTQVNNYNQ